jgi:biotin carboxyl carrier protein
MSEPSLLVRVDRQENAGPRLLSPGVGWWSGGPCAGAIVGPGSRVGRLRSLNRRFVLIVPDGVTGRVVGVDGSGSLAVGFDQVLFRLEELSQDEGVGGQQSSAGHADGSSDLAAGMCAVTSPTDGVFYRGASPEAPPFVEVGSRVRTGQPIGLVEVMKTFNQIVYEGPPVLPEEATVLELRCDDGAEVAAGQILLVVG